MDGGRVTQDEKEAAEEAAKDAARQPCPKCGSLMELAAVIPHATDQRMAKHTYLCTPCNQTRNYMLPATATAR
jgi:hypothetical protein